MSPVHHLRGADGDILHLMDWIHLALAKGVPGSTRYRGKIRSMNVSSVSAPPTIVPLDAGSPKPQDATAAKTDDGTANHQPTPPAPLPPGQGTRVDQLV